jgi:hypothetical protein
MAYDKGLRIITASRGDQDAVEVDQVRVGILVYALFKEGLEKEAAAVHWQASRAFSLGAGGSQ